jgi:4-oxalocrotonate tautomerase
MPYVEVKLFDYRVSDESAALVIERVTDALCEVVGEQVRDSTWVVVEGVQPTRWGIAGKAST